MDYSYRTENGTKVNFKCTLGDIVTAMPYPAQPIKGEVIALDDDGYITLDCDKKEIRVHNDNVLCVRRRVWVRMSGWLEGTKEEIDALMERGIEMEENGEHYTDDIEFSAEGIKGMKFISENEGYIPESVVSEYFN